MQLRRVLIIAFVFVMLGPASLAQPEPAPPEPIQLATARLPSVVDMPLYFRLYRVHLPAAKRSWYRGSNAMLYGLSGTAVVEIDAVSRPLAPGAGVFIAAGQGAMLSAPASEAAELLLFVLTARPNQRWVMSDRVAVTREVFRTGEPLPGLRFGTYDFTLARVTVPAGAPATPPHYRTGAALDYVLAGSAAVIAGDKTEATPVGAPLFERYGWVHRLANPGNGPLVLLQANINREGEPPVHVVSEK